jgi:hypothetical protein
MGDLEGAGSALDGPGERAAAVAEQLGVRQ